MKNVAFMMIAAGMLVSGLSAAQAAVSASANGDRGEYATAPVGDRPLAGPYSRAAGWPPFVPSSSSQMSGSSYFYAPGTGPRCELRVIRLEGRLYQNQSCDRMPD